MKKQVPKSECTWKIEWDRSVLKILTFWSRSRVHSVKAFSFSFFFYLKFFAAGSDRVRMRVGPGQTRSELSGWWRHGWRHCFGRVCTCGTCVLWRLRYGACARVSVDGGACTMWRTLWRRAGARDWFSGPKIFRFCCSKAVQDSCRVSFVKFWACLHKSEGLGRGSSRVRGGAWMCVQPLLGLKF